MTETLQVLMFFDSHLRYYLYTSVFFNVAIKNAFLINYDMNNEILHHAFHYGHPIDRYSLYNDKKLINTITSIDE